MTQIRLTVQCTQNHVLKNRYLRRLMLLPRHVRWSWRKLEFCPFRHRMWGSRGGPSRGSPSSISSLVHRRKSSRLPQNMPRFLLDTELVSVYNNMPINIECPEAAKNTIYYGKSHKDGQNTFEDFLITLYQ